MSDPPETTAEDHEQRIEQELREYLRKCPRATDELDGIFRWWLPRHEVRFGLEIVARVLARLEAEGTIERTGDPERPVFRLRRVVKPGNGAEPISLDV